MSSTCPNYDVSFQNTLRNMMGMEPTPEQRKVIYYTVCIFVRLALASYVSLNQSSTPLLYLLLVGSFFSSVLLYRGIHSVPPTYWWSKRFHMGIALGVMMISIYSLYTKQYKFRWIGALMYLSVFGGLYQSTLNPIC